MGTQSTLRKTEAEGQNTPDNSPPQVAKPWLEFINIPGTNYVRCPRCGKRIVGIRMAKGAHAAWCLRQAPSVVNGTDKQSAAPGNPKTGATSIVTETGEGEKK